MLRFLLAIVLCVAADQAVKLYTVSRLTVGQSAPLLRGFVELLYVQNTGGGFSILAGHTWLLTAATALIMAAIAALLVRRTFSHPLALWSLTLILGGGLGNLIDRVRLGYVVDMFHFQFFPSYPVFNVADMCVVAGVIGFAVYYLLLHDRLKRAGPPPEDGHGADTADGGR